MAALEAARGLALPGWCLAAGFVRNLVWDRLPVSTIERLLIFALCGMLAWSRSGHGT
jgi:hypothetical protein